MTGQSKYERKRLQSVFRKGVREGRRLERAANRPAGLSPWSGWDRSKLPWSESKHKDRVCAAVFGPTWSMEDAATLIEFIEQTWPAAQAECGPAALDVAGITARMAEINTVLGDGPRENWMRPLEEEFAFCRGQLSILKATSEPKGPDNE